MFKGIIYKEWTKTKWVIGSMLLIGLVIVAFLFLKLERSFRFAGYEHLWDVIINRNQFMFSYLKYYPLLVGLGLAVSQWLPEILSARLKLTMHLPMRETRAMYGMTGYSLLVLLAVYMVTGGITLVGMTHYFPREMVGIAVQTLLPWFLAGFTAYLLLSFTLLEPLWKRRALNVFIAYFLLTTYFIKAQQGAYEGGQYVLFIIPVISWLLAMYSTSRYKAGVQAIA